MSWFGGDSSSACTDICSSVSLIYAVPSQMEMVVNLCVVEPTLIYLSKMCEAPKKRSLHWIDAEPCHIVGHVVYKHSSGSWCLKTVSALPSIMIVGWDRRFVVIRNKLSINLAIMVRSKSWPTKTSVVWNSSNWNCFNHTFSYLELHRSTACSVIFRVCSPETYRWFLQWVEESIILWTHNNRLS